MRLPGLCVMLWRGSDYHGIHIAFQYGGQIVKDALALKLEIELVRAYPRPTAKIQHRPPPQVLRMKRADIPTPQDADTRFFMR